MNTLKRLLCSDTNFASAACFSGLYVMSLGAVAGMINGTQLLLGLI